MSRSKDSMPALNAIMVLVGNRRDTSVDSFGEDHVCATCAGNNASEICDKCKAVQYCDRECQRVHWFVHERECMAANNGTSQTYDVDSSHVVESLSKIGIN